MGNQFKADAVPATVTLTKIQIPTVHVFWQVFKHTYAEAQLLNGKGNLMNEAKPGDLPQKYAPHFFGG